MEGEIGELQDWEVLHSAVVAAEEKEDGALALNDSSSESIGSHGSFAEMIKSDYFSLENQGRYGGDYARSEEDSVESDNPSWIDPVSVTRDKELGGFWSDSGSERSDDRKSHDFEVRGELGLLRNEKSLALSEPVDENSGKFGSVEGEFSGLDAQGKVGTEEIEEVRSVDKVSGKFWSDSGGESSASVKLEEEGVSGLSDLDSGSSLEKNSAGEEEFAESKSVAVEEVKAEAKPSGGEGEGEKRMVLWWKVPLEVLKYCVFKVSPVWSFSMAAAVMGLVILGRRLYRMKRKSQSLQLKVTLDDKKVSQFTSRAVRLNEAFTVGRRIPILRPSLPASGVNPWPVMSLR